MEKPDFKSLRLGKTSAEKESLEFPVLLTDGFFDPDTLIDSAKQKGPFLFLGHKGSGKSAIGEHLRLTAENEPNFFVKYMSLGDFPYTSFAKIVKGDLEPEAKYPDAWSWLLLLQLIEQLASDQGSSLHQKPEAYQAFTQLNEAGILPTTSLKYIVQQTTKNSGGIKWKLLTLGREESYVQGSPTDIPFLVERLKQIVFSIRSESKHLLVIDGVDELLGKRSVQLESLASLVYEIDRLNWQFSRAGCPTKILLLCRTDIYEILPNANKNKIRQDSAVELIWYSDAKPADLKLVRLANHRASIASGLDIDIFDQFFPRVINCIQGHQDVRTYLLEFTRHTPRDFITLLNYIQKATKQGCRVNEEDIRQGLIAYSSNYFMPEIRDELNGHMSPDEIDGFISVLSAHGKKEFTVHQLITCLDSFHRKMDVDLHAALAHLFECSGLGMLDGSTGNKHFTIKYRNRHAILDFGKKLVLHKGLVSALNLK